MKRIGRLLLGFMLLAIANIAFAAIFCVGSAAELQMALTTAASNGQDDEVQVVQGNYVGNFVYDAQTEAYNLSVVGGYNSGCTYQIIDPTSTILDGDQINTVLKLSSTYLDTALMVKGITLRNGKSDKNGGGVYIDTGGVVTFTNNWLKGNSASDGGGAYIASIGEVILTNNRLEDNFAYVAGGGAYVRTDHFFTLNGVTFTNNILTNNISYLVGGGAYVESNGRVTFTNNILEGNSVV